MKKLFVVRKYIYAESAIKAIEIEKKKAVDDCWVDDKWKEQQIENNKFGFNNKK